ncbi:MAG: putative transcriptional regulator [Candidatus Alkanophagales archaeon MCA70_species_2]|nr:putative transcriptional regulator [Candidatus Alkanophaga liquidiphilum]
MAVAKILQNKRMSSKFQILVEIAANQPNVKQRDIAAKLNITPQAVSEYVKELIEEGMVATDGRGKYRVTKEGVDFILRMTNELEEYSSYINNIITNISVWAAVADDDLKKGEGVSLRMKNGILYACKIEGGEEAEARAVCISDARRGEDVGITDIKGMIALELGKITVCIVPRIQNGGSKKVDLGRLKQAVKKSKLVGVIGIEALVALSRINRKPDIIHGTKEATIEASSKGLPLTVVCVEDEIPSLLHRLEGEGLSYELLDLRLA